jgi:hypothetical protein
MAANPALLIKSIASCLASVSSPDVKMTVRGLLRERSCIRDIGMLLIDFTRRAPDALSATSSLDVHPFTFNAARDRVNSDQTDIGYRIDMRVRRIDQNPATPIDAFQRFR